MSRTMTDLEDSFPFNEWNHAHHPVFPAIERNTRRDEVIGERELVIKNREKETQERFQWKVNNVGG